MVEETTLGYEIDSSRVDVNGSIIVKIPHSTAILSARFSKEDVIKMAKLFGLSCYKR